MSMTPSRRGSPTRLVGLLVLLGAATLPIAPAATASEPATAPTRPNILILLSDDQAWSTFNRDLMPTVFADIVDQGVLFDRAYVNTSQCCPSRSEILTGLDQHQTGVSGNLSPFDRPTI